MARMVTLPQSARKAVRLLPILVLSGLALRSYHYLRVPAVWHDEAALVVNVLDNDFAGLLGPLRWHEAAPPLFFLSYPACFLYGGLLVALLPAVWRQRKTVASLGYALLVVAVGGSFLMLVLGPARAQHDDTIMIPWRSFFPQWDRPWSVPS